MVDRNVSQWICLHASTNMPLLAAFHSFTVGELAKRGPPVGSVDKHTSDKICRIPIQQPGFHLDIERSLCSSV